MNVEQWMKQWLETYVKPTNKPKTYSCYDDTIRRIIVNWPELSESDLADPKELAIQQFINRMADNFAKSTLNDIRVVFRRSYDAAIRNDLCSSNPAEYITLPINARQKIVQALTFEEQTTLEAFAHKDILGHIVIFFLRTGLRASELMNLKWTDYDADQQQITIRNSKTRAGQRIVPLIPAADSIIQNQPRINECIFTSTVGTSVTSTVLKKLAIRMREATGIPFITTHVYRHCFATRLVEKGVDYKALSNLLGHTDVAFTLQQYVTAETEFLHRQISLLEGGSQKNRYIDQSAILSPSIMTELKHINDRIDFLITEVQRNKIRPTQVQTSFAIPNKIGHQDVAV